MLGVTEHPAGYLDHVKFPTTGGPKKNLYLGKYYNSHLEVFEQSKLVILGCWACLCYNQGSSICPQYVHTCVNTHLSHSTHLNGHLIKGFTIFLKPIFFWTPCILQLPKPALYWEKLKLIHSLFLIPGQVRTPTPTWRSQQWSIPPGSIPTCPHDLRNILHSSSQEHNEARGDKPHARPFLHPIISCSGSTKCRLPPPCPQDGAHCVQLWAITRSPGQHGTWSSQSIISPRSHQDWPQCVIWPVQAATTTSQRANIWTRI